MTASVAAFTNLGFHCLMAEERAVVANAGDQLALKASPRRGLSAIALASDDVRADSAALQSASGWLEAVAGVPALPASRHPNGVVRLERVYIAVEDIVAAADRYARALRMPRPAVERGTVINADMAVFNFSNAGLTLAQPRGPGVAAKALEHRGPGPFQVLYRTRSMDAAARWMSEHDVPPPVRGIRNTGEQAMLVPPEYACGIYLGFVGLA